MHPPLSPRAHAQPGVGRIINNVLISSNDNAVTGSNAYAEGPRTHEGDKAYNNIVIRVSDYYNSHNTINMGENSGNQNNHIQWNILPGNNQNQNNQNFNPIVPHYTYDHGNSPAGETGSEMGYIDDGSIQGKIGDDGVNHQYDSDNSNQQSNVKYNDVNTNVVDGVTVRVPFNTSDAAQSVGTDNSPLSPYQSSASSSDSQSVSKAFEIDEIKETENFIPSIFFIIAALILLIVGYARKDGSFRNN